MFSRASRSAYCLVLTAFCVLLTAYCPLMAQTTVAVRDPNAVALAARALQAMVGATALNDIILQANATCIACLSPTGGAAQTRFTIGDTGFGAQTYSCDECFPLLQEEPCQSLS
jgi:hypothetical protein